MTTVINPGANQPISIPKVKEPKQKGGSGIEQRPASAPTLPTRMESTVSYSTPRQALQMSDSEGLVDSERDETPLSNRSSSASPHVGLFKEVVKPAFRKLIDKHIPAANKEAHREARRLRRELEDLPPETLERFLLRELPAQSHVRSRSVSPRSAAGGGNGDDRLRTACGKYLLQRWSAQHPAA